MKSTIEKSVELDGFEQVLGDVLGLTEQRVASEMHGFKELLEARGEETGAWRGEIPSKDDARG